MKIGAHVSSAGGVWNAPKNAAEIGCEIFQMFSRPPQGGKPTPITTEIAKRFRDAMFQCKIERAYIHAPYFINLASSEKHIRLNSINVIRDELERGSALGCRALMFHPGSAKDVGQEKGIKLVIEGLDRIMDGYTGSCQLLIEISAGAGAVIGDSFEEIASLLDGANRGAEIGVCFDTQHAFASGYDLRTDSSVRKTIKDFDRTIGLECLVVLHVNDSMSEFNSHKDRHEHLGNGKIGLEGFKTLVGLKSLSHVDLILETPDDNLRRKDLLVLKNLR